MTKQIRLSPTQVEAFDECIHFFMMSQRACFVLSGYAGTGKTSLIKEIVAVLTTETRKRIAVLSLTGRAVSVLREKGVLYTNTIHSFLYEPIIENEVLIGFARKSVDKIRSLVDGIIIDEASMVNEELFDHLLSLELPILFVGDSEQLPPISKTNFNVMDVADISLTEIHRQAADNPIIQLSQYIRETGRISRRWEDGKHIRFINRERLTKSFIAKEKPDIICCGFNNTRKNLNALVRSAYGYTAETPEVGETIMCLKNKCIGDSMSYVHNGELCQVINTRDVNNKAKSYNIGGAWVTVMNDTWITEVAPTWKDYHVFTYGYVATAWKLQGSQFKKIVFIDEDVSCTCDRRKYRYTAVTRASDELIVAY